MNRVNKRVSDMVSPLHQSTDGDLVYRFYVYEGDMEAGEDFEYDDDAIDFAQDLVDRGTDYEVIVERRTYSTHEDGSIDDVVDTEIIWSSEDYKVSDSRVSDMTKPVHLRGYAKMRRDARRAKNEELKNEDFDEKEEDEKQEEVNDSYRVGDAVADVQRAVDELYDYRYEIGGVAKRLAPSAKRGGRGTISITTNADAVRNKAHVDIFKVETDPTAKRRLEEFYSDYANTELKIVGVRCTYNGSYSESIANTNPNHNWGERNSYDMSSTYAPSEWVINLDVADNGIADSQKIKDEVDTDDVIDGLLIITFKDGSQEDGLKAVQEHANEQGDGYETYEVKEQDGKVGVDMCAQTSDPNGFVKELLKAWGVLDAVADVDFKKSDLMKEAEQQEEVSDSRKISDRKHYEGDNNNYTEYKNCDYVIEGGARFSTEGEDFQQKTSEATIWVNSNVGKTDFWRNIVIPTLKKKFKKFGYIGYYTWDESSDNVIGVKLVSDNGITDDDVMNVIDEFMLICNQVSDSRKVRDSEVINTKKRGTNDIAKFRHFEDLDGNCYYNVGASYDAKLDMDKGVAYPVTSKQYKSVNLPTINDLIESGELVEVNDSRVNDGDYTITDSYITDSSYGTSFTLTNPVNDYNAALDYLQADDMTQYLIDDLDYLGLSHLEGKIKEIRWVLEDEQSGYIVLYTTEPLAEEDLDKISEWISGQCSDGLGEGFEQQRFAEVRYYDEDNYNGEYGYNDYDTDMASFDWQTNDYKLKLYDSVRIKDGDESFVRLVNNTNIMRDGKGMFVYVNNKKKRFATSKSAESYIKQNYNEDGSPKK